MKRVQNYLEYWFVLTIRMLVSNLPLRWALIAANMLGLFAFHVIRLRRQVTIQNLCQAFPEKSRRECKNIAERTYCNFAKMAVEYIRFPKLNQEELQRRVRFDNVELLQQASEEKKGVVCVAGHFGNWEMMAAAVRALGYPMVVVVAEQRNKLVDELINSNRARMGIEVVSRGFAIRGILKAFREKKFVALLADQDAHEEGTFVEFMSRPASTPQGPAALALKIGAPMVFGTILRQNNGYHRVLLERVDTDDLRGLTPENIRLLTQKYTRILEKYVKQYPDHWFWMHRRWKTSPIQNTNQ
jgi:KDO2-lipid IV(A) lauroyltransferase